MVAIAGGGGVNLFNSQGNAWTADYLKITGELDVDLRSNIAAEARAKIVYERLINFCRDAGTKDALQFLMTREITHMRAFTLALESMGKPPFSIGSIAPTRTWWISSSTIRPAKATMARWMPEAPGIRAAVGVCRIAGTADLNGFAGDVGPISFPPRRKFRPRQRIYRGAAGRSVAGHSARRKATDKALPKMIKAAHSEQLQRLFDAHLQETEAQVERLNESLQMLKAPTRAKLCKGMAGLIAEGEEVIKEAKQKEQTAADLALIGASQRVEHYEIAAYTTARNLAVQLRQPAIVQFLTTSLGEEQNAGQLLDQVAQPLMSVARMPATVE